VRRLEGMKDFIPRAAQQELARAVESTSAVGSRDNKADEWSSGAAGAGASLGRTEGTPPLGAPPPAPQGRASRGAQGVGAAAGWSVTTGFQEGTCSCELRHLELYV